MWRSVPFLVGAHASMHSGDQLISCGLTLSGELTKDHRSERQNTQAFYISHYLQLSN
jgi:hypothetical protein